MPVQCQHAGGCKPDAAVNVGASDLDARLRQKDGAGRLGPGPWGRRRHADWRGIHPGGPQIQSTDGPGSAVAGALHTQISSTACMQACGALHRSAH